MSKDQQKLVVSTFAIVGVIHTYKVASAKLSVYRMPRRTK